MKAFHLSSKVQNYDWGKIGEESKVAQLMKSSDPNIFIDSKKTYAELWMGTHPNGESIIKSNNEALSKWIKENYENTDGQLPFLLKVLSVNKALSIQCHPDKEEAKKLHALRPDIYKDPNHKPELAIALTEFKAMCGFRKYEEIQEYFTLIPEFCEIIGNANVHKFLESPTPATLRHCFHNLMSAENTIIEHYLKEIQTRFSTLDHPLSLKCHEKLFNNLLKQFPNDVGVLCIYFLNILDLKPGEAIYLCPNIPHAYISGDCVECMACSDNVIRAGLTPKYKDVDTLIRLLDYGGYYAEELIFKPVKESQYTELFKPPVPDFAVSKTVIPYGQSHILRCLNKSHSVIIIVTGKAKSNIGPLIAGNTIFVGKNEELRIEKDDDMEFVMYQAISEIY